MPRSQGIPYEIHPSPKKDEKGLPLLYVRPLKRNKISMEGIPHSSSSNRRQWRHSNRSGCCGF
jgi:hypothetical protein